MEEGNASVVFVLISKERAKSDLKFGSIHNSGKEQQNRNDCGHNGLEDPFCELFEHWDGFEAWVVIGELHYTLEV